MTVIHYMKDEEILCGTKAKTFKSTDDKKHVTCKRCLKRFNDNSINVRITKKYVILSLKKIDFLFSLKGKIENFMFSTVDGTAFTSPGLYSTQIKRVTSEKDRNRISESLRMLKADNNGLYAEDVYEHFNI